MAQPDDLHGDVGTLDVVALEQLRTFFRRADGLVDDGRTGIVPSLIDPRKLVVTYTDGIGDADWARFDITWYTEGYYSFHHVDERGVQFRFDYHPKPDDPARHVHPPVDAPTSDVEPSCITVSEPVTVGRAVHLLWRRAYNTGDLGAINDARNPP